MRDWQEGRFYLMNPIEIAHETLILLEHIDSEGSVFRANHASNYVNLAGTLNQDREAMCARLRKALEANQIQERAIPGKITNLMQLKIVIIRKIVNILCCLRYNFQKKRDNVQKVCYTSFNREKRRGSFRVLRNCLI